MTIDLNDAAPQKGDEDEDYPEGAKIVPTSYANTFFLTVTTDAVRIVFGEYLGEGPYFRTAVAMPLWVAEDLIKSLNSLVVKQRLEDAEKLTKSTDAKSA